ncbi:MAG: hypothetical protein IKX42_03710 [Fibrobacter sp.]|nr:hypothetical protein [Fibrobacter sp.]
MQKYTYGTPEGSVSPDGYTLDIAYSHRPEYDDAGNAESHSDKGFEVYSRVV